MPPDQQAEPGCSAAPGRGPKKLTENPERRAWFELATVLGKPVSELKATMSHAEFIEWVAYFKLNKTPQNRTIDAIGQATRNVMEMFERWMRQISSYVVTMMTREVHKPDEFVMYRFDEPKQVNPQDQWDNLCRYMEHLQKHG